MTHLKIGLDLDDVLFPWSEYAHAECRKAGITNGRTITQWGFHNDYGIPREALWDVLFTAYAGGMLMEAPYPRVAEYLAEIQDAGHSVHIATARGFGFSSALVRDETYRWFGEWGIPYDTLTFTKDKCSVDTDYFLDDSIPNVAALRGHGVEAYVRDQPHNRNAQGKLPRMSGLSEFIDLIHHEAAVLAVAV